MARQADEVLVEPWALARIDPECTQRLVPLATWSVEFECVLNAWCSSNRRAIPWDRYQPNLLTSPDQIGNWLRKHEERLVSSGVALRLGNAWRIVEPGFQEQAVAILNEELAAAQQNLRARSARRPGTAGKAKKNVSGARRA